jgi:hypothetical protein
MIAGACWIENVITLVIRTHHCWENKRKLPKFIQLIQRHMKTTKEKQKKGPNISSSMKRVPFTFQFSTICIHL